MADQPFPLFRVLIEEYNYHHPDLNEKYPDPDLKAGCQEYDAAKTDEERRMINSNRTKMFYTWLHDKNVVRSALCFSGGGIRSATFGLGVLQGLARKDLLQHFDFLSTVSGGGFLGSWLSAWIHRKGLEKVQQRLKSASPTPFAPEPEPIAHLRRYSNYMTPKLGLLSADTWTLVATFIRNLILNWLVLLPLILLVLMIPRFCVVAVRTDLERVPGWLTPGKGDGTFWLAILFGILSIAYMYVNRPSLADRKLRGERQPESLFWNQLKTQAWFLKICLLPLLATAVTITTYYAWVKAPLDQVRFTGFGAFVSTVLHLDLLGISSVLASEPWFAFVSFGVVLNFGGLLLALFWRRHAKFKVILAELAFAVIVGGSGGLFTWLIAAKIFDHPGASIDTVAVYVCFAAPAFLSLFLLAATLFVGASSKVTSDADREWMARAGAWILIACGAWSLISTIVIYGPLLLVSGFKTTIGSISLGTLSGIATLVLGRSSRSSAKDGQSSGVVDIVLLLAAPLFAVFILISLSLGTSWLISRVGNVGQLSDLTNYSGLLKILDDSPFTLLLLIAISLIFVGTIASLCININKFSLHGAYRDRLIRAYLGASRAEGERTPNPFTGLDENDNLQMQQLRTQLFHEDNVDQARLVAILKAPNDPVSKYVKKRLSLTTKQLIDTQATADELKYNLIDDLNDILQGETIYNKDRFVGINLKDDPAIQELIQQQPLVESLRLNRLLLERAFSNDVFKAAPPCRPLHIINVTLNLVGGKNLAWQDRKAESFTVSALHSGSYCVGYRNSNVYGQNKNNHAISLGTAATISGAAVSPNMGYYSSTFVTFLLSLFNLRLGWWLGNPGAAGTRDWGPSTYDKTGPNFAVRPLIDETLGLTDDQHPYVYLSDGGHFENLALYEMVLRRCKRILISDGSADEKFGFEGLGNAVSKIRVDLGIPIDIKEIFMLPRDKDELQRHYGEINPKFEKGYCAVGTIRYSNIDGDGKNTDTKKYDGLLIYIKAFLSGTEPVDIYNYARIHPTFPHESTGDQMFSESQFESYRALGSHIVDKICENTKGPGLEGFFSYQPDASAKGAGAQ